MTRTTRRVRSARRTGVAAGVAVLLMLTGCSQISAQMQGAQVTGVDPGVADAGPVLVTQQWGVVDGMLSVVVTNATDRTLRFANATITARDAHNVLVASSSSTTDGSCCRVVDLPAGQQYGFYFDAGSSAAVISAVDVVYRDVAWAPSTRDEGPTFKAVATGMDENSVGAVVVADVTTRGGSTPQAVAQAFLTDADGDFLAVVSGRWDCFTEGDREIRMQLFHPVPAGTTVESVVVH
ncbi:MAG: hypothetical protein JWO76_3468, partial [Nocardioides sp.]|nr:hypothetical protein [Nocardioides sp.]